MPVGLKISADITPVPGVKLAVAQAGVKYANRDDVTLIEIADGADVAAVFTKNKFCAAPVIVAKEHLEHGTPKYLLVNTGNANAGTGGDGIRRAKGCCQALAELCDVNETQVLPFSTGVIGETLP
ncbi:MAG: bifunctional ornithine acetyltransferase/N-acetylglutamate synthase, partial [Gammaproteobacteria bacterium]|nr:bifunctional ornithine acetyltransferase/N-acetylglutamate synthase [Gammaproteobacteria bacterium]